MYSGYITKLKDVRPHPNADRLQLATVFGNQVVISLEYKEGDLGLYFPTDGRLGEEFANINNLVRRKNEAGENVGGYLEPHKRHIRTIKLRGEFSDGLFLPIECLEPFTDVNKLKVGDIVKEFNGVTICEKYVPYQRPRGENNHQKKKAKVVEFTQFEQHTDTKQLAYCMNEFQEGDLCYITNKMHGTSGRTTHTIREITAKKRWYHKLLKLKPKTTKEYDYASGSRRVIIDFSQEATGFYKDNNFRKIHHDFLAPKLRKGETIYYEIVGYVSPGSTIMPICDNSKIGDKAFIKKYGDKTTFSYGCQDGESDIYAYRMTMTNEDGQVVEYPHELLKVRCDQMGVKVVEEFDKFIFTTQEDLMERVNKYESGPEFTDPTHIREGVVVRIERGEEFKALKFKNVWFKILEGILKDNAVVPDMEEEEDNYDE